MDSRYIFDPEGDTLLVLKKPDDPYTVLGCDYIPRRRAHVWDGEESNLDVYKGNWEVYSGTWSPSTSENDEHEGDEEPIQMKVSAKHLSLASSYFKVALSETWRGPRQPGKPTVHEIQEFDVNTMVTLMNVIHGHGHKVSRDLSIVDLVRFTIVMDYFQCAEICSPYTDIWTDRIMHSYGKNNLSLKDNLMALWAFNLLGHEEGINFFKKWSTRTMSERPAPFFLPGSKQLIREIDCDRMRITHRLVGRLLNAVWAIGSCDLCFHDPYERFCKLLWSYRIYDAKRDRVLFNCSINTVEHAVRQLRFMKSRCACPMRVKNAIEGIIEDELGPSEGTFPLSDALW